MGEYCKTGVALAFLAFLVAEAKQARGADVTWDGSQNQQWTNQNNWSRGQPPTSGVPGANDTAIFSTPVVGTPSLNSNQSVQGVVFTGVGGWTIAAGNTLTVGSVGIDKTGIGLDTVAVAVALNGASTWTVSSGTLAVSGIVSGAPALTKNGAGTLLLSASSSYSGGTIIDAGTLTFATAGNRLSTTGSITMNGGTLNLGTFNQSTSGNVTIAGGVVTNGTLTKAAGNFAAQSGTVSAVLTGNAGLIKTTAGTMLLNAANSYLGGTTIEAGTLQFGTGADRLSATGNITMNGGMLNLGGFGQTTSGSIKFAGGSVGNGTLTKVGGSFNAESGSVSANGILAGNLVGFQKTTGSVFTLNGNHTYTGATVIDEGTLIVNGSIASSSGVAVASGAKLGGHGIVSQISGAGTVSPGESPAILTTSSVNGSLGLDFHFEFTNEAVAGISAPDFLSPATSGNDLLRITDNAPFTLALTSNNVITVDFSQVTLSIGDRYLGGFYTTDYSYDSFSGADFQYLGLESYGVSVSMIEWSADFGVGPVSGFITQFEVIPEPSTVSLLALSAVGMAVILRKRRISF